MCGSRPAKSTRASNNFQIIRNHMGPVGFLNLHNMKMFAKHRPEKWFFMQLQVKDQHIATTGSVILLMVQKSGEPVEVGCLSHDLQGFIHPRWWSPDFWTIKSTTTPRWWNEFQRISTFSHVREFWSKGNMTQEVWFFDSGCFGLPIDWWPVPQKNQKNGGIFVRSFFSKAPTV